MSKEKVHGGVAKLCVDPDDGNHAQVSQYSDGKCGQEEEEQGHLEVRIFWEAQEDEGHWSSLVFLVPEIKQKNWKTDTIKKTGWKMFAKNYK